MSQEDIVCIGPSHGLILFRKASTFLGKNVFADIHQRFGKIGEDIFIQNVGIMFAQILKMLKHPSKNKGPIAFATIYETSSSHHTEMRLTPTTENTRELVERAFIYSL